MTDKKSKRPSFELSSDTRFVYQRLLETQVGETVTYGELARILKKDVSGAFPALQSALRRCLNHDGIVFGTVRGVGYKRLSDDEIVAQSESGLRRVYRVSRKEAKKLAQAEYASLPPEEKAAFNARMSALAALAHVSRPKNVEKLVAAVKTKGAELAITQTLEALK